MNVCLNLKGIWDWKGTLILKGIWGIQGLLFVLLEGFVLLCKGLKRKIVLFFKGVRDWWEILDFDGVSLKESFFEGFFVF